jgi:two-component system OmpR family response regulator
MSLGLVANANVKTRREKILIVEDEIEFSSELGIMLERYGFEVYMVASADQVIPAIRSFRPAILVLDQFVHNFDMLSFLPKIRTGFDGGIMILTGNTDSADKIIGLESGADDFVIKTTEPREILARLRSLTRRTATYHAESRGRPTHAASTQARHGWNVNLIAREVRSPDGVDVELTGMEFDTFSMLFQRTGEVVSREDMVEHILERHIDASGRSIENLVSRVRTKFKTIVGDRPLIKSVRGKGYAFLGFD